MKKLEFFRKKYPVFIYQDYSYKISNNNLEIFFDFAVPPDISFQHKIVIENTDKKRLNKVGLPAEASAKEVGPSPSFFLGKMSDKMRTYEAARFKE